MTHIRIKDLRKYMRSATSEELEAEQAYIDSISIKFKEVVYGEWISDEDGNIHCSVCGRGGVGESFCEHCGADMRGNKDGCN